MGPQAKDKRCHKVCDKNVCFPAWSPTILLSLPLRVERLIWNCHCTKQRMAIGKTIPLLPENLSILRLKSHSMVAFWWLTRISSFLSKHQYCSIDRPLISECSPSVLPSDWVFGTHYWTTPSCPCFSRFLLRHKRRGREGMTTTCSVPKTLRWFNRYSHWSVYILFSMQHNASRVIYKANQKFGFTFFYNAS